MSIVRKIFYEANLFDYKVDDDLNIITKDLVASFCIETDDPDLKIIPLGMKHNNSWISGRIEITKKDQRNLRDTSEVKEEKSVEEH